MKSRTVMMYPKAKQSRSRKKCPEGMNCPYKQEYQHDLEFSHDEVDVAVKTKKSRGEAKKLPESFAGSGQRLGESMVLRESFQPTTSTTSSSSSSSSSTSAGKNSTSSSSSSSSSTGKSQITSKKKLDAVRAVRANAASGREQTASPTTGRNSAGGCGRNGSGIFSSSGVANDNEVVGKKLLKKRSPLSCVDMNSFESVGPTSSFRPDHVAEDKFCPIITSISASHNDRNPKQKGTEKVMATKNTIINIDCDDDDEIVFLGTASDVKNSNDKIRNSRANSSSYNDYDEAKHHGGNNLPPIIRKSSAPRNSQQDDSFPVIIINDNNRRKNNADWNYRNNLLPNSSTSSSSRSSSQSTYDSNYHSDDYNDNYIMHEASNFDERRVSPPSSAFPGDQMLKITCEICNQKVHINSYDYHLRRHELSGDDVKLKQDREYEKSVEEEVMKRTAKEAEQRAEEAEKNRAAHDAAYSAVLKQSEESAQRAEMVRCRDNLSPEPVITDSRRTFRIRFCLPVSADKGAATPKLVRKFLCDSSFQDAINFLRAQESLLGHKWCVRMSVGEEEFSTDERRTFSELSMVRDTNLLVVLQDPY